MGVRPLSPIETVLHLVMPSDSFSSISQFLVNVDKNIKSKKSLSFLSRRQRMFDDSEFQAHIKDLLENTHWYGSGDENEQDEW